MDSVNIKRVYTEEAVFMKPAVSKKKMKNNHLFSVNLVDFSRASRGFVTYAGGFGGGGGVGLATDIRKTTGGAYQCK